MTCLQVQQGKTQLYTAPLEPACHGQWNVPRTATHIQLLKPRPRGLIHHALHQALGRANPSEPVIYAANVGQRGGDLRRRSAIAVQQFALHLAPHATLEGLPREPPLTAATAEPC